VFTGNRGRVTSRANDVNEAEPDRVNLLAAGIGAVGGKDLLGSQAGPGDEAHGEPPCDRRGPR